MWTKLKSKEGFQDFVRILKDNELKVENTIISENSEDFFDMLVVSYNGSISSEDLNVIKNAFGSNKVKFNNDYLFIRLPEKLWEED